MTQKSCAVGIRNAKLGNHLKREMNEGVMVIQTALFTLDYNYQVVHVLTAFLQSNSHVCLN